MSFSAQKVFITDRNTPQFNQLSGWLVSDDPAGEEAGCGGPELLWLHVVVRPVGRTVKFFKWTLEAAYGRALVDIPAISMPIAHSLKT